MQESKESKKRMETKENSQTRQFYTTFRQLAIPIALQHMVVSTVNLVDVFMLAALGTIAVAGVGLANQVYFLLVVLNYGLYSGMGVFLAQYWGKRDMKHIHCTLGLGLSVGTVAALLFTAAAIFFPYPILRFLSHDEAALLLGASYLRIVGFSYLFTSLSNCLGIALRSVGQPRFPLLTSTLALLLNVLLNYLLIFGKLGLPALGADGAAIGTLLSRTVEFLLLMGLILRYHRFILANVREMLDFPRTFILHYAKIAAPVIVNESLWGLGMVMYVAAYEKLGTDALAVSQVTSTVQNLTELVAMGIGNAAAVMIGNIIGEGSPEKAFLYAQRFLRITFLLGALTGLLLAACIPLILWAVQMTPEVKELLLRTLLICAALVPLKAASVVIIVGILRGGGDTRYAMLLEALNVWLIGVPLAFIGALAWKLPIYWLMLLINLEEVGKVAVGLHRTWSKRWITDVTRES